MEIRNVFDEASEIQSGIVNGIRDYLGLYTLYSRC